MSRGTVRAVLDGQLNAIALLGDSQHLLRNKLAQGNPNMPHARLDLSVFQSPTLLRAVAVAPTHEIGAVEKIAD